MALTFDSLRDAQARVPARPGLSPAASAVAATLEAVFGADVAATLRQYKQPLGTVKPRVAMKATIGGLDCTLYADPAAINVLTPKVSADGHLRAHARRGDAIVESPSPRDGGRPWYAGIRYTLADR